MLGKDAHGLPQLAGLLLVGAFALGELGIQAPDALAQGGRDVSLLVLGALGDLGAEAAHQVGGAVGGGTGDAGLAGEVGHGERAVGALRLAVQQPLHGLLQRLGGVRADRAHGAAPLSRGVRLAGEATHHAADRCVVRGLGSV
jgi:hypothetical protein